MANVFSNPTYKSNIGFNEFPIRQHKQFSSTVGHLLPVYFDYLKPGDKVSCGCNIKTRLQPMVTPAFCKIEEHVDWFFVPLKQIFEPVVDILYGIQDFSSDVFDGSSNKAFPLFTGSLIQDFVVDALTITASGETNAKSLSADDAVVFRCLDLLGFPVKSLGSFSSNILVDAGSDLADLPSLPVWFAGAYQKIWSDHYRLTDWQENNAWLYNFDSFQTGTAITSTRFKSCFTLHRAAFKRDFNTYVLPSPVFGASDFNAFGNPVANINQWLTSLVGTNTMSSSGNANTSKPTQIYETKLNDVNPASNLIKGDFNPANIRTLFAAEKYLEITRRAGKHYDKQVLAHYGINVPTGIDGESFFLGGQTQDVIVTDVFATAETEYSVEGNSFGTPLGKMAGKGFGNVQGGNINFTAKCEGILMAIYYAIPDVVYENTGYDPLNRLVRPQDFYNPQFDDLGMQPSFMAYRSLLYNDSVDGWSFAAPSSFSCWQWRYMELKSKPNIALGSFVGSMDKWTLSRVAPEGSSWVDYIIPSNFLDPIMVAQYSDAAPISYINNFFDEDNDALTAGKYLVSAIYDRDPMLHDAVFFCNKVSKMSKFGIGSL